MLRSAGLVIPTNRRWVALTHLYPKARWGLFFVQMIFVELRSKLRGLAFIGPALIWAKKLLTTIGVIERFRSTSDYWENRYRRQGNSGAGSYGRLARFKAETLNTLIAQNRLNTAIEFGCGDGNQLSLVNYRCYVGLDVSKHAIARCSHAFDQDDTKSFLLYDSLAFFDGSRVLHADLTLSLDVIYHLVEDQVFQSYMYHLFAAADRFVVIYSSNEESPPTAKHVRHRKFTDWVDDHLYEWKLAQTIPNKYPFDPENSDSTSLAQFFVYTKKGSDAPP